MNVYDKLRSKRANVPLLDQWITTVFTSKHHQNPPMDNQEVHFRGGGGGDCALA